MNHRLIELGTTYEVLVEVLALIRQTAAGDQQSNLEQLGERIVEAANDVSLKVLSAKPTSGDELAWKARVVLDWLNEQEPDLANALAISLCRDVLQMFPADDNGPLLQGKRGAAK